MNTHADKAQEHKSQSIPGANHQMQGGSEATFQFVDNRPEAIAQRVLQKMANDSHQAMQLGSFQDMGHRHVPKQLVKTPPFSLITQNKKVNVIQKLDDESGVEITEERLATENNLDTLRVWAGLEGGWEDWDILAKIRAKVVDLEAAAEQAAKIQAMREEFEAGAGCSLPNFSYLVQQQIQAIPKYMQIRFFQLCQDDNIDPGTVATAIINASTSNVSRNKALVSFADGTPMATAMRLASDYDGLMVLRMATIDGEVIKNLVTEGFLGVKRETYSDNPRVAGSVYVFYIKLTGERLIPEWHVHWGRQNRVEAASFKDISNRRKTGHGVRVNTDTNTNEKLRQCIKAEELWGP